MDRFRRFISWAWSNLSNFAMLFGWAMSFALPAWAASSVELLQAYAPLSWVMAGFTGWALMAFAYMMIGAGSFWRTTARIRATWAREHDQINPLEKVFRNQRINISDLITPFERVIEEKTFIDCELIGPANVIITASGGGGTLSFHNNTFLPSETVLLRAGVDAPNAIIFSNCSLSRNKFYGVTLFFYEGAYAWANRAINNLHWVSLTPDSTQPLPTMDSPVIPAFEETDVDESR